jgi:neutral ceramidase
MAMNRLRRWLLRGLIGLLAAAALFVTLVGPWPVYSDSRYRDSDYYSSAVAAIESRGREVRSSHESGPLRAGWASVEITPPIGTPLAGYGGRERGMRSQGVRDPLFARALALTDDAATVLILAADMLIVPPRIAAAVRSNLEDDGLTPHDILFNASHTHAGPGAFAPGFALRFVAGKYDPAIETMLIERLTAVAREALTAMRPAQLASGSVRAPDYIKNRARKDAPVDDELSFLVLARDDGERCMLLSYSAHPTVFGSRMMVFSRDYPGELQDFLEARTGAATIFLSGAVGSMGPSAPKHDDDGRRAELMGRGLASRVLPELDKLEFSDRADIASLGIPVGMPPLQLRPFNARFRMSPWVVRRLGIRREGWIQAVRLGDVLLIGTPFDFSGETSLDWKAWAASRGVELWPLSFCGDYCGYQTPDRYYLDEPLDYETSGMSWFGPDLEAYFTDLYHVSFDALVSDIPAPALRP